MLTAIIIDDELSGRETLKLLLKKHAPDLHLAGTAGSAAEGKELIFQTQPDLVFLDIQMPGGSGFDLLASIDEIQFEVVFITAFNQFATRAFKFAALDYIEKPPNVAHLKQAIARAQNRKAKDSELKRLQYQTLQNNMVRPKSQDNRIGLPTQNGLSFVQIKQIVRCKGSDAYSEIYYTDGRKEVVSKKLTQLEDLLLDYRFCRIHKSHLINLNHLHRYTKGRGGEVEMSDGSFIEVSRRKKTEFLLAISE